MMRSAFWGGAAEVLNGGHAKVTFKNGNYVFAPMTPSDRRGIKNCLLELERAAGQKLPRQKAGKFKFKKSNSWKTAPESKKSEATKKNESMLSRLNNIDRMLTDAIHNPVSITQREAEELVDERTYLVRVLKEKGYPVNEQFKEVS